MKTPYLKQGIEILQYLKMRRVYQNDYFMFLCLEFKTVKYDQWRHLAPITYIEGGHNAAPDHPPLYIQRAHTERYLALTAICRISKYIEELILFVSALLVCAYLSSNFIF